MSDERIVETRTESPAWTLPAVIVLGLIAIGGLAFGLAIVFALEARDTTFRTERDVERILKRPALAMIPLLHMPKGGNNDVEATIPRSSEPAISGRAS